MKSYTPPCLSNYTPLLGFKQLLPAARTLHRSLGTDNGHINNKNITKSGITHISAKQHKYEFFDVIVLRKPKVCSGKTVKIIVKFVP